MAEQAAKKARTGEPATGGDTVVYPGDAGSLAHIAATHFFKDFGQVALTGVHSFAGAFKEVASGRAAYGVIPIENSASGTLHSTYDLILEHDVVVCGELGVREVYVLCGKSESMGLGDIRRVLSHPNIIDACSSFIETRLTPAARASAGADFVLESRSMRSTTEAARLAGEAGTEAPGGSSAAIATKEAAERYGLTILAEDIGNDAFLETRYILIHSRAGTAASRPSPFPRDAVSPLRKRSACFALRNEPSAIYRLMACWAMRNIDIMKIETRPLHSGQRAPPGLPPGTTRLWDYLFYVDYAVPPGQTAEADKRLQDSLKEFSLWHRDFGTYPSQTTRAQKQAQSWEDMVDIMTKS